MSTKSPKFNSPKAFVKWVGGKSLFVDKIVECLPPHDLINTYHESFLGAGSVFFSYKPKRAILSDLNSQLIETFKNVKTSPRKIYSCLQKFISLHSEDFYYNQRKLFNRNRSKFTISQAARFIYLNKACFNGIYRVNVRGEFNVPFGYRDQISVASKEEFVEIAKVLSKASFMAEDYAKISQNGRKNDVFYFDPPYPPLNKSSYFTHYTKDRFGKDDQIALARVANKLAKKGCYVLITNADKKEIKKLYRGWHFKKIRRARALTCLKKVHRVQELIITNYEPSVWVV